MKTKNVFSSAWNQVKESFASIEGNVVNGAAACIIAASALSSCSNDEFAGEPDTRAVATTEVVLPAGFISDANLHWTADKVWKINGKIAVPVGKTLKIDAGTQVIGMTKDSPKESSALIVPKGARIEAVGTASNPIVMSASNGTKGGWGGIVILGEAPINQSGDVYIEGIDTLYLPTVLHSEDFTYGGSNPTDDSGILQYVRVEYAGASVSPDNELNAFTLGGVGSGTTIDHCQAYHGADDSFEFFGGTVNAKYLVSTATDDDAFDFDFGYCGKIQFAVATIDASMTYSKDPNGIECDNDGNTSSFTPLTHPVLSNLTLVGTVNGQVAGIAGGGTALKSAADFRRNCQFELHNSILYGFPKGVFKETTNSFVCKNNIVSSVPAGNEFSTFTPDASNLVKTVAEIGLTDAWGDYRTSLVPTGSSIANTGASFTGLSGFDVVSYKGALDPDGFDSWLNDKWVK